MRVSAQLIAGLALAASANASLYGRARETSTSTEVATTPTETATMATPVVDNDISATETNTPETTESDDVATVLSSTDAHPAETTSIPLIKPTAAASSSTAASSSAASVSTTARPKATGTGDYVGLVDPNEESSSSSGHSSGRNSDSGSSGSSSSSSGNDDGEENAKPTTARHTNPGSTLVVPGLTALGSLAIGLLVLV
ncbi:hypothetical protein CNMCM8980_001566 [Aspergillus fumigatiaffinis]|uniref:GPI anchored protein n=1 Tax=Aspergillus fumigatiaffinis TaxID=340414 RepID=A0A8H4MEM4_9EURO|nr:hypothetical protein CNMCM5878_000869 [Aspergillus fumigatiaffinis]KAF4238771.1 hypothetical protein CNMCM6457_009820 [Aspergillus fumigatiaffinis]KAF4244818.1 hypothetical protein CNMCM6805_007280 [Aspergillus fumigatiaffinis]KAF4250174.1 hypothetical protein CNMCM8980_001566 [Aspergillus fumigatiaffinis]